MDFYRFNSKSSFNPSLFDPFKHGASGFGGALQGGAAVALPHSLVLDSEKGELVKAPARVGKKGVSEAKALAALKNHSEAERRRRERINAHLSTLRGLVPCTEKMDKAALLAAVISQVKELKKDALESSKGFLIPVDDDEVKVEPYVIGAGDGTISVKASVCCEYRSELLSDLREALDSLHLKMVKAEIATLGNRVKNVFVLTSFKKDSNDANTEAYELLASSVHQVLSSVLDKASPSPEYSPRTTLPSKRRRLSYFDKIDTSSSSS
ncbi:transcription factor bHLH30-like [Pyrus communis]|uniref:transcription factor bHLH30-like n=1 Tax=Pyrus communis TaxID=23211 RepID=UPI0035C25F57